MKGLLFKSEMIQAIKREANPKTQTRRICVQPEFEPDTIEYITCDRSTVAVLRKGDLDQRISIPYIVWQTVYVKEKFEAWSEKKQKTVTMSPMFMPEKKAKTFLQITKVPRIERVASISDADCLAEGIKKDESRIFPYSIESVENKKSFWRTEYKSPRNAFHSLWNSINAKPKYSKSMGVYISHPFENFEICSPFKGRKKIMNIPNPWIYVLTFENISEARLLEIKECEEWYGKRT